MPAPVTYTARCSCVAHNAVLGRCRAGRWQTRRSVITLTNPSSPDSCGATRSILRPAVSLERIPQLQTCSRCCWRIAVGMRRACCSLPIDFSDGRSRVLPSTRSHCAQGAYANPWDQTEAEAEAEEHTKARCALQEDAGPSHSLNSSGRWRSKPQRRRLRCQSEGWPMASL